MTLVLGMLTGCAAAQTETSQGADLQTGREQATEEQDALPQEPSDTALSEGKPDADTVSGAEKMAAFHADDFSHQAGRQGICAL